MVGIGIVLVARVRGGVDAHVTWSAVVVDAVLAAVRGKVDARETWSGSDAHTERGSEVRHCEVDSHG